MAAESGEVEQLQDWYRPGPSIQAAHDSAAFVRVLNGGRGTGKTFFDVMETVRHSWWNAGAKVLFLRKTETSQQDSTNETMSQVFEKMGDLYKDTGYSLFKSWNNGRSIRLPSLKAIEAFNEALPTWKTKSERLHWLDTEGTRLCGFAEMRGLPNSGVSQSKLRGFECSLLIFVEADQIERKDFELSFACLRWKGSDPDTCNEKGFIKDRGIILDTNPPSPSHWIAQLEKEEMEKPEHDRKMEFWHISTYENEHNLPPNYIQDTILLPYARNSAMIERMLWGRYADAFDGSPVFYAYRPEHHEATGLGWPRGATLVVGMDVGTNNVSIISAYKVYNGYLYWWALREVMLTGSDTDRQSIELLKVLAAEFPFWNSRSDICPQTLFFCDPAARNSSFTVAGPTSSALKVLQSHGIHPGMKTGVRLQPSIAACNRLLQQNHVVDTIATVDNPEGKKTVWHFKIDKEKCPLLARAMAGEYRYPSVGEVGFGNDEPLKGSLCNHADHPCFVAGTLVLTARGEIPIESVVVGDMMFTRSGLHAVLVTGNRFAEVQDYHFSNGARITCTPDHPFWVVEQSRMIPIALLMRCDTLRSCTQIQKLLSLTGRYIAGIQTLKGGRTGFITNITRHICTMRYGNCITEKSQKESTSITSMEIQETTPLKTWSASLQRLILRAIGRKSAGSTHQDSRLQCNHSRRSGTHPKRGASGIGNMRSTATLEKEQSIPKFASNAIVHTRLQRLEELLLHPDSVPMPASRLIGETLAWTMWIRFARHAAQYLTPTDTHRPRIVPAPVESAPVRQERVYNITVAEMHEYYANGLLVSNCDGWRYSVVNVLDIAPETYNAAMTPAAQPVTNLEPVRRI